MTLRNFQVQKAHSTKIVDQWMEYKMTCPIELQFNAKPTEKNEIKVKYKNAFQ